jgi:peptide deformylase
MYNLVDKFDPILKQKLEPFDFDDPPMDPNELSSKLMETCIANKGVAISANQVGLPYRVFIINMKGEIMPIFNPIIISTDLGEDVYYEEGCLTYTCLFLKIYLIFYKNFKSYSTIFLKFSICPSFMN